MRLNPEKPGSQGMSERYAVTPRTVLGKRAKRLRREGVLPGNIYGRGLDSVAVQLPRRDAESLLSTHGLNSLFELAVDGEKDQRPVIVRQVQRHPLSREILHLDFYQVDLARPIQANVPVTLIGEASAVHTYQGILITGLDHVLVEALPAEMPSHIELSVDSLEELDSQLTVADLAVADGVRIMSEPEIMLARIARPRIVAEDEEEDELLEGEEGALEEGEEGEGAPAAEDEAGD